MNKYDKIPTCNLVRKLYEVDKEINELKKEYNELVLEIWERVPTAKLEPDFQLVKVKENK